MTKKELKLLKGILRLDQTSLKASLSKYLKSSYGESNIKETKRYIIATGNIPVCLVAHLDTVHKNLPLEIYYDKEKDIMWSPQGLGADDRAGVFSILQIIKSGLKPHVIFTTDEEIGGIGATFLAKKEKNPFKECNFLIELDRHGLDDCVFYELDSLPFENFIESYGFSTNFGTFSDICELAPAFKCAAVNLSIGYMNEHTLLETLNISWMYKTIDKVKNILMDAAAGKTKHYEFNYGVMYHYYNNYFYNNNNNKEKGCCYWCLKLVDLDKLKVVKTADGYEDYYCPECYKKYQKEMEKSV